MNKVEQIGRLTRDPELRYTPNNRPVAQFTIAVKRRYAREEDAVQADFFQVVVWGKQAENCKTYLNQGSLVGIVGELRTRNYEDNDGVRHYLTEILASEVHFLSNKKQESAAAPTQEDSTVPYDYQEEQSSLYDDEYTVTLSDDDLPF